MALAFSAALFGLMVGSFLNVVIYRVPRHESVSKPRSRCPGCGTPISPRDNIPVFSWLVLRGRCRTCSEPISIRYPAIELLTAMTFVLVAIRFGLSLELVAFCVLFAAMIAVTAVDLELRLIPKRIVWPTFAVGLLIFAGAAMINGEVRRFAEAVAGALGAFGLFFTIHFVSPRGMGFGDVRLAALAGLFLGWLGPAHVGLGLFTAFAAGGVAGVIALALGRSRKSALPFGPFLGFGALLAVMAGQPILGWYLGVG